MTSFAAVAPLSIQRQLADLNALGRYNLLIASEILKELENYRSFWRKRGGFTIMDNGIIETGAPLPLADLAVAAEACNASAVILPDTIDDANMTMKQVRNTAAHWRRGPAAHIETMGVVQGRTFAECMDCADSHLEAGVNYLAVPRGLTPNLGSRYELVSRLEQVYTVKMHLLGFSEDIHDDIMSAAASPLVMGIDAATPVWLGLTERSFDDFQLPPRVADFGRRPEWFWQTPLLDDEPLLLVVTNLRRVRRWLADASWAVAVRLYHAERGRSGARDVLTGKVARLDPAGQ